MSADWPGYDYQVDIDSALGDGVRSLAILPVRFVDAVAGLQKRNTR